MQIDINELAAAHQRSRFPLTPETIRELALRCGVDSHMRVLDLACGKGELLVQWASQFAIKGTGVDESENAIAIAHQRADDLKVWSQLQFSSVDDVAEFPQAFHQYNLIVCLEASWVTESLQNTLALMRDALRDNRQGILVIGETYWRKIPPDDVCESLGIDREFLPAIGDLPDKFRAADVDLLDMLIVPAEDVDQHYSRQWRSLTEWLYDNEDHADALTVREWLSHSQKQYLTYEREYLGQGLFILSAMGQLTEANNENDTPDWF